MTINDIGVAAARFTPEQNARLLARLSFELTIAVRETYVPGTGEITEPGQIRAYNEMQHRVSACLSELLDGRIRDLWIWPSISEFAAMAGCGAEVSRACLRAFQSIV